MHHGQQSRSRLLIIRPTPYPPLCLTQFKKIKSLNRNLLHYNKNKILIKQSLMQESRVNKFRERCPLFHYKDSLV